MALLKLRCEMTQPFGFPVDPEVKIIYNGVSGETTGSIVSGRSGEHSISCVEPITTDSPLNMVDASACSSSDTSMSFGQS